MASGATVTGAVGLAQPARASAPRASSRLVCDMGVSIVGAPSGAPESATVTRPNVGRRGQCPSNGRALGVNHLKRRQLGMRRTLVMLLAVAAGGLPGQGPSPLPGTSGGRLDPRRRLDRLVEERFRKRGTRLPGPWRECCCAAVRPAEGAVHV